MSAHALHDKIVPVADAIATIRSGTRVFVGSGCAEPQTLVKELTRQAERLSDVEIVSLLTLGTAGYADPSLRGSFRHNAYFIGTNVRAAVSEGRADYTPVFLSEIPDLIRSRQHRVDTALVQVSPPDRDGFLSLGISVDVTKAAVEHAGTVIAEINPNMPRTRGGSLVHVDRIDRAVEVDTPLIEYRPPVPNDVANQIGMHVASLIDHGSCLQLGIGALPDALVEHLLDKRDLGIHTEMFAEGILPLLENGNVTNRHKAVRPGRTVTSFVFGTRKLYDLVDDNEDIEFHPSDLVNDPRTIAQNDKVVAINSALQVDLSGQVCADGIGERLFSGIGGQVDFIRGAATSRGGKPIIALPSTAKDGEVSRIVAHLDPGAGVVTSRGDVHYVVTEYGVAYLHGKSIRERALALTGVAHPSFRRELLAATKKRFYMHVGEGAWRAIANPYPNEWETERVFGDERFEVRPLKPTDARHLQEFFYSHTPETVYHRYFTVKRRMTSTEAAHLCTLSYRDRMAFGVFHDPGAAETIAAIGRYDLSSSTNRAETAIVVGEQWRGRGIGTYLLSHLMDYAKSFGITGITAELDSGNQAMLRIHRRLGHDVRWDRRDKLYHVTHRFDFGTGEDPAGPGHPEESGARTTEMAK